MTLKQHHLVAKYDTRNQQPNHYMKTKPKKHKRDHTAKLLAYDMHSPAVALRVAKWMRDQSKSIIKEVKQTLKNDKTGLAHSGFAKRYTARLMN